MVVSFGWLPQINASVCDRSNVRISMEYDSTSRRNRDVIRSLDDDDNAINGHITALNAVKKVHLTREDVGLHTSTGRARHLLINMRRDAARVCTGEH